MGGLGVNAFFVVSESGEMPHIQLMGGIWRDLTGHVWGCRNSTRHLQRY